MSVCVLIHRDHVFRLNLSNISHSSCKVRKKHRPLVIIYCVLASHPSTVYSHRWFDRESAARARWLTTNDLSSDTRGPSGRQRSDAYYRHRKTFGSHSIQSLRGAAHERTSRPTGCTCVDGFDIARRDRFTIKLNMRGVPFPTTSASAYFDRYFLHMINHELILISHCRVQLVKYRDCYRSL